MSNPVGIARRWPALVVIIGAVGVAVTVAVAMSADWGPPLRDRIHPPPSAAR